MDAMKENQLSLNLKRIGKFHVERIKTLREQGMRDLGIMKLFTEEGLVGPTGAPLTRKHISTLMIENGHRLRTRKTKEQKQDPLLTDMQEILSCKIPDETKIRMLKHRIKGTALCECK